jgi:hypothetical protein
MYHQQDLHLLSGPGVGGRTGSDPHIDTSLRGNEYEIRRPKSAPIISSHEQMIIVEANNIHRDERTHFFTPQEPIETHIAIDETPVQSRNDLEALIQKYQQDYESLEQTKNDEICINI